MAAAPEQKPRDSVKRVEAEKMMSKYLAAGALRHLCRGPTCFFMLACLISMSNLHPGVCFDYYNEVVILV